MPRPIWLPIVAFAFLLTVSSRLHRRDLWHPGRLLIALYLAMSVGSLAFDETLAPSFELNVTWGVVSAYTALLCVALTPAFFIRRPSPAAVVGHPLAGVFDVGSRPFILFSVAYLAPWTITSLQRGSSATRHALNVVRDGILPESPWTTLAVGTATYYLLFALLLFIALARRSGRAPAIFAALGMILAVMHTAVFGARDGFIWVTQAILVANWAVGCLVPRTAKRRMVAAAAVFALIGVLYTAAATRDRFAESVGGYASGTVAYFGGQPYVFSETVSRLGDFYGATLRFPLLARALGGEEFARTEPFQWSFGTFLCDFYGVSGWSSAVLLTLGLAGVTLAGLRLCWRRSALGYTLVVALYTQFMTQGIFYYRLGNWSGNVYHVSILALITAIAVLFPDRLQPRRPTFWPAGQRALAGQAFTRRLAE